MTYSVVVLSGAGISAESGIEVFRSDSGLWAKHSIADIATPKGFRKNPNLVYEFYNSRKLEVEAASPNPAHHALANFEEDFLGEFTLITQNIDNLHERGGSKAPLHMHGSLFENLCKRCQEICKGMEFFSASHSCPSCHHSASLRPNVVWFGEHPYHMDEIYEAIEKATIFVAIGTSGTVYPAAGFVDQAHESGAHCIEVNVVPSDNSKFHRRFIGPASSSVPEVLKYIKHYTGLAKPEPAVS